MLCEKGTSCTLTLSQMSNFRLFQTERVADDNCKVYENGRKFFRRVKNTLRKGETALNLSPDDKNLTLSKSKAFEDDKINVT